ncbi:MAG: glycerol kinase GlpK [Halobacteriales archaeon]|nr:glycerol kinase GlpK [Halobacteriales archaeon]
MGYVASIDQGTTGTRFMVFDRSGTPVGNAYAKHEQIYPRHGWVEHDPDEIWERTKDVVLKGLDKAGIDGSELEAIGVTNQRETTVVWDEDGTPLHNAVVWQDRRTTERVEELFDEGRDDEIRAKTGLEPNSYFSATKLEWLLENEVDDTNRDEVLAGTVDSWLVYNLTDGEAHVTDTTNASRTMLFDIHELRWDDGLLDEFDVPRSILPDVRASTGEVYGHTSEEGFLGASVPVAGALGDQQSALFGQTCFEAGDAKNTYGTGSFFLTNTGNEPVKSQHGLLTTVAFQRAGEPPCYALEGSVFMTGGVVEWLDEVGMIDGVEDCERVAREAGSSDGVYFVPAFTGLGAPYWDERASGTIVGMSRDTRSEHIVRAALESIAYQTRDVVEAMEDDSGVEIDALRVDGGAVQNDLICELQASIVGTDIVRPVVDETTALGAAYTAGLTVGYWESLDELRENRRIDRVFEGDGSDEDDYARWKKAVERARGWE